ncbi:MAG: DUF3857 domain-containing transglutaminase family protein [Rhizobiaceae bacterium]
MKQYSVWLGQFLFAIALIVTISSASVNAQGIEKPKFAPAPGWITQIPVPEFSQANLTSHTNGEAWLLSDVQTKYRPGGNIAFKRYVTKIIERTGLESSSNLRITIDPSRQKLTLNKILVIRSGLSINHESDVRIDSFNKEGGIADGTLTGYVQNSILVPDVRVGDIVDVSYTIDTIEVVPGLPYDRYLALAFDVPVERLYGRIIWPKSDPLTLRTFNSAITPATSENATDKEYVWDVKKPDIWKSEPTRAPGKQTVAEVIFSSAAEWKEIVDLMEPYYTPDKVLPAALVSRLGDISKKFPEKSDQLTEALRIVQDEIRYVSLSIGPGALIPRSPVEIHASGYGDCKDKALLLATMLNHLGITAHVALADLDQGPGVIDLPPSIGAFDHAIVRAELAGSAMWLDATDFSQGGRGLYIEQAHYGYALPLKKGVTSLERMPDQNPFAPTEITTETYDFPIKPDGDLVVDVETIFSSSSADQYRRDLANSGRDKYVESYYEYYLKRFPNLEKGTALIIDDNRDKNEIRVRENYRIRKFGYKNMDVGKEFPIVGQLGLNKLPTVPDGARKAPLYIGSAFSFRHVIVAKNLNSDFSAPETPKDISPWFTFSAIPENKDGTFTLTWNLKSEGGEVKASDVAKFKTAVSNISNQTDRLYNFAYQDEDNKTAAAMENAEVVFGLSLLVALVTAIVINWQMPSHTYTANAFQPVSLMKFFIMSLLTGGLYNYLWAWNGFRQHKLQTKSFGFPLLQSIIHPLLAINILNTVMAGKLEALSSKQKYLLLAGTLLYFAIGAFDLSMIFHDAIDLTNKTYDIIYNIVLALAQAIGLLPIVHFLNTANAEQIAVNDAYRKFSNKDWLAIAVLGPLVYCLILIY